jgi:hypothetical protein
MTMIAIPLSFIQSELVKLYLLEHEMGECALICPELPRSGGLI